MRLEQVEDNYESLQLCLPCLEALAGPATSGQGRNFLPRTECHMCFCGPIFCDMAATVRQKVRLPVWVVCHERRLSTTVRNCTRDEGGPFEVGNQVLISSHRKMLSSKAMVVNVAETPRRDSATQGSHRRAQATRR